jgi:RNA:NAD 2'-phosphotransferase (TPT1/KptA family)
MAWRSWALSYSGLKSKKTPDKKQSFSKPNVPGLVLDRCKAMRSGALATMASGVLRHSPGKAHLQLHVQAFSTIFLQGVCRDVDTVG